MAYTNNVPQGNQQIATTQPIIQANFGFLQTGIGTEHNFNAAGSGTDMYHLRTSMPNQSDPGSLPAGTHGQYYVKSGAPKFYDGSSALFIQTTTLLQKLNTGSINLTNTGTQGLLIPARAVGNYYLLPPSGTSANSASVAGQFVTSNTHVQQVANFSPNITVTISGSTIFFQTQNASVNGTYTYVVVYYTP